MGRQKTLWIDEACWEKLQEMGDDSTSSKVRRAIMQHDTDFEGLAHAQNQRILALRKQIEALKAALNDAGIQGWWTE